MKKSLVLAAMLAIALAACGKKEEAKPVEAPAAAPAAEAPAAAPAAPAAPAADAKK
jgi:predicted small lipoprotein YifL